MKKEKEKSSTNEQQSVCGEQHRIASAIIFVRQENSWAWQTLGKNHLKAPKKKRKKHEKTGSFNVEKDFPKEKPGKLSQGFQTANWLGCLVDFHRHTSLSAGLAAGHVLCLHD